MGLGCLFDDDHGLLLQLTDPTRNFIYHPQDFEVSEPELIPRDHFADPAERESVRLTAAQNGVLRRNKVKQNLPLRVGLFKLFIYIQQKLAKLRNENGEEIGPNSENQSKDTPDLVSDKNQAWSSKMCSKLWDGTWRDSASKSKKEREREIEQKAAESAHMGLRKLRSDIRNIWSQIACSIIMKLKEEYSYLISYEKEFIARKKLGLGCDFIIRFCSSAKGE